MSRPSLFQESRNLKAAQRWPMQMPMPQDVEASTKRPKSCRGPRGMRSRKKPSALRVSNHHRSEVRTDFGGQRTMDSDPLNEAAKLESAGR